MFNILTSKASHLLVDRSTAGPPLPRDKQPGLTHGVDHLLGAALLTAVDPHLPHQARRTIQP